MADFASRPEVTVSTMGKVHNPSGKGVHAVSSQVKAKTQQQIKQIQEESHETKTREGTAKRNITRKKSDGRDTGNFDSRNKKQGGHGKGQWKEQYNYDEEPPELDEKDPLYDEADGKYILSSGEPADPNARIYDPIESKAVYGPMLTLSEFKIQLKEILTEYFDSCDSDEVIRSLEELKCQEYHPEVIKKAISLSLDKGPRERELVSRLLTWLHPTPLSYDEIETGFSLFLDSLDDLSTDVPEARTMGASFLARAVVDEVLPPAFLSEQNNERPGDSVIEKAVSLLSREHCTARLEKIWGPGDGRPVTELKESMDQLLKEYLMSRELDEAARCVTELKAAHFHHELVKRGVRIAMEEDGSQHEKSSIDAMAALFSFLVKNAIVSEYQVAKGIGRLHEGLEDMRLDVPTAPTLLEDFERMAREGGCLPASSEAAAPAAADAEPPSKEGEAGET